MLSTDKILVHNSCWQERLQKFTEYADNIDVSKLKSQDETIEHLENVFSYLDKTRTDDRVLKLVNDNESNVFQRAGGVKEIVQNGKGNATYVFPDGGFQIFRGGKLIINKQKK